MSNESATTEIIPRPKDDLLTVPPILAGTAPDQVQECVDRFFLSIARIFDVWVARRSSKHTQRAYRQDVMAFIAFRQIAWPGDATTLFRTSVADVHGWRDHLVAAGAAPRTLNWDRSTEWVLPYV